MFWGPWLSAFLFLLTFCDGNQVFLGKVNSTDVAGCGISPSFPCATLAFILDNCIDGDTIIIEEGVYSSQPSATVFCENTTIFGNGKERKKYFVFPYPKLITFCFQELWYSKTWKTTTKVPHFYRFLPRTFPSQTFRSFPSIFRTIFVT